VNSALTQMKSASSCLACEFVIFRTVSIEIVVQKFGIKNALGFEELSLFPDLFFVPFLFKKWGTEIRVFYNRLCCYFGNQLHHENDHYLFTNKWAFV